MFVAIAHGSISRPERSWFPWLSWQLLTEKQQVFVPRLPTPQNQSYENWRQSFLHQLPPDLNGSSWIGHSTGVPFLLRLVQEKDIKLRSLILVSGFIEMIPHPEYHKLLQDFVPLQVNSELIHSRCESIHLFHGDNDEVVPFALGEKLAKALGVEVIKIEGGGHLNTDSGYLEFPLVLQCLRQSFIASQALPPAR